MRSFIDRLGRQPRGALRVQYAVLESANSIDYRPRTAVSASSAQFCTTDRRSSLGADLVPLPYEPIKDCISLKILPIGVPPT